MTRFSEAGCHELVCEELNEIALEILGNVGFGTTVHKSH